ncbi:cytoskeleton-associated protein 2 isoform X1 [Falco biarmicus]|uniref:cytoskeleton-associated protein 2 isoform X1 n=1 Tax=Falco cherrug TaxID=345164 RepID=UPI0024789311|nr:cytoskeleton-associated protein 2 isoform X1 [Falco cherrug]XP_056183761.1 cytoskeleton-associated protein 2 isoform X1 [Falco biarmicus]
MAASSSPQLSASRRSEPAFREQRQQKVEEYLSRKKTFSGVPVQKKQASISSSRTRRATSNKLQDKTQLSSSPKPEIENNENANKLPWDQSSGHSEKSVILNSSTTTLTNSISGTNYNEDHASKDEVTELKSQHVSLSKSFLQMKSIKEKQSVEEKQNSGISLPKKPVFGVYRGKVIQSKVNSFRKAPKSEGEKSSLPDKKFLPPATKPAARSLSISRCNVVLKTIKVTNNPNSVKANYVLPFQSKPSNKAAINSQSHLKEWQLTSVVAPKKVTENTILGRVAQPLKAASNNSDHRILGVKKCTSFCEGARPEAPAKPVSVVPGTKSGQNLKTNGNRKSLLPKESAEARRARLDEWRASRGKVLRRPPICVQLGPQSTSEEQGFSSGESLEHVFHNEKVNRTLAECLKLTEQGCQSDEVRAMLEDMAQSTPGAKKLAKYWICCIRLEQMGPLEKVIAVYEEAILAGAMPKDELRHTLINIIKNTESLFEPEDGGAVVESGLHEVVEVSGSLGSGASEQVQEASKDLCSDDQKAESDDTKAEANTEVIKNEEMDSDLKPREDILPKKNKTQKTKEGTKKKGKCGTEEQNEDEVKDVARSVNSPEKENGTPYFLRYNQSTTPYLGRVKMHHEAHDSSAKDLKIVTPLRCSQRIREKMRKLLDTVKDQDPCVSSFEQLGELE